MTDQQIAKHLTSTEVVDLVRAFRCAGCHLESDMNEDVTALAPDTSKWCIQYKNDYTWIKRGMNILYEKTRRKP